MWENIIEKVVKIFIIRGYIESFYNSNIDLINILVNYSKIILNLAQN